MSCSRHVTFPRPRSPSRLLHSYAELVHLAIQLLGLEPEYVLAVEFLGDPRKRRTEIGGFLEFEITAAGFVRELLQPAVRFASHHPRTVEIFALESDRIDH